MKRFSTATRVMSVAALTIMGAGLAGCGGGASGGSAESATTAKGPIKIWYSNNEFEVKWGKAMVAAWNAAHPDEKIDAQEIPAGKSSEEVIGAAITAGNAPCLVFNTAPVAVPQFQKQGGLVAAGFLPRRRPVHQGPHRRPRRPVQVRRRQDATSCRGSPTP